MYRLTFRPIAQWLQRHPGLKVQGFGLKVPGFESRVAGSGFRVSDSGFRVAGSGFRVAEAGARVVCMPTHTQNQLPELTRTVNPTGVPRS